MPALYAHDRFGKKVTEKLDGELKEIVEKYNTQFRIGLQGPDIFFFYRPFYTNKVNKLGHDLHLASARPFFEHACEVIRKTGRDTKEYAYLCGFICHFILDSECHPYVDAMISKIKVQHLEIEEEFEKKLLRMDREDPFTFPMADLVPTDEETARAITPFYEGVKRKSVKESLRWLRFIKRVFTAPNPVKYHLIDGAMRLSGKYPFLKGLMNHRKDNMNCIESNYELLRRFNTAVDVASEMIQNFDESVRNGSVLSRRFDRNFE